MLNKVGVTIVEAALFKVLVHIPEPIASKVTDVEQVSAGVVPALAVTISFIIVTTSVAEQPFRCTVQRKMLSSAGNPITVVLNKVSSVIAPPALSIVHKPVSATGSSPCN